MRVAYRVFETSWGWCAVAGREGGLCAFALPMESPQEAGEVIAETVHGELEEVEEGFEEAIELVRRYFLGEEVEFNLGLDLSLGTPFMRRVWETVQTIPYGEVRTYRWVAREIGSPRAFRAVGMALARNPLPLIVPCHRVIGSDGSLKGFTAPGGIEMKRRLLEHEREVLRHRISPSPAKRRSAS